MAHGSKNNRGKCNKDQDEFGWKIKHRVFCLSARVPKFQFDTKQKAILYLKYNAQEIGDHTGVYPCRAYYCPSCCKWHVTSQMDYENGHYHVKRRIPHEVTPEQIARRLKYLEEKVAKEEGEKQK